MKLAVDIGNTTINLGFYKDGSLTKKYIFDTYIKDNDYFAAFKNKINDINFNEIKYIIFSSVVPKVNTFVKEALNSLIKSASIYEIETGGDYNIKMDIDNPKEVGGDLLADLVGAKHKYQAPLLVIDLGTATKFLYLDENYIFQSALIIPGMRLSASLLFSNTELLPNVDLSHPTSIMDSKNTSSCIINGIVYSHLETIKGISISYENESKKPLTKILTGGDSKIFQNYLDHEKFIFDDSLVLDGEIIILNELIKER